MGSWESSRASPGPEGNITGVASGSLLAGKRLEVLKEVVPRATRIALLTTAEWAARAQVKEAEQAAVVFRTRLVVVEVQGRDEVGVRDDESGARRGAERRRQHHLE